MPRFEFHLQDVAFSFLALLFEAIPFLLLGAILSGLIEAFVPARWMTRLLPRSVFLSTIASGFLGLIFPMCECGVVPVIRRLIRKGLPVSCAVTYMLSAPVISPIVLFSTYTAFKGQEPMRMVLFRAGFSFLIAVLAGLIVSRLRPEQFLEPQVLENSSGSRRKNVSMLSRAPTAAGAEDATFGELERELEPTFIGKVRLALARGAADFLDVAIYLVIGAALTSIFNTSVPRDSVLPLAANPWTATFGMMGLAVALALCSTSDAFIAATFTTFPFAAKLAFLTLGPMLDVKLMFLYRLVFRARFIVLLSIGLILVIGIVCVRLTAFIP